MKFFTFSFFLFFYIHSFSQNHKDVLSNFTQFEISFPLRLNENRNVDETNSKPWYSPNGLGVKLGYGYMFDEWIGISVHSGLDWTLNAKMVSTPVYAQASICPKIGESTRFLTQFGLGQSFVLGRGKISGNYYKARVGFLNDDDFSIFIDGSFYGFTYDQQSLNSLSLGISVFSFD